MPIPDGHQHTSQVQAFRAFDSNHKDKDSLHLIARRRTFFHPGSKTETTVPAMAVAQFLASGRL